MTHPRLVDALKRKPTKGNTGSALEHLVAADLMDRGYEVFMSCGPNSKADIVARLDEDNVVFIEVRTMSVKSNGDVYYGKYVGDMCDLYAGAVNAKVVYFDAKDQYPFTTKTTR